VSSVNVILSQTALKVFSENKFFAVYPSPLTLYGCKAHRHWAQAE